MQEVTNDLIGTTFPLIPQTEIQLKETEVPLSIVLRPFLSEVTKIQMQLLRIPKCKICSAYFSPFTHWICPHSRYFCCMCHEIVAHQNQRFIICDTNKEVIPELNENCVEYCGEIIKEEIIIRSVIIVDNYIVNEIVPFLKTIKTPFVVLICSEFISTISKNGNGYYEKLFANFDIGEIHKVCAFNKCSKTIKISQFCSNYKGCLVNGQYPFVECLYVAKNLIGRYGVIQCFHSVNFEKLSLSSANNELELKSLGIEFMKNGIMVNNYFVRVVNTVNTSTFRYVSKITNGNFVVTESIDNCFIEKINRTIVGFNGNARVRSPKNVDVITANGCVEGDTVGDCKIGVLTKDLTIVFQLQEIKEMLPIKHQYQVIINYVGLNGQKCVRVLNLGVSVAPNLTKSITSIDPEMVMISLTNKIVSDMNKGMTKDQVIKKYTDKLVSMVSYMGKKQPFSQFFHVVFNKLKEAQGLEQEEILFNMERCHRNILSYLMPKIILMGSNDQFLVISNEILVVNCNLTSVGAEEFKAKYGVQAVQRNWETKTRFIEKVLHQTDKYQLYYNYLVSLG